VTERLRAVLDTNVFVSAFLSRNPSSPTQEILRRWQAEEFVLLTADVLVDEIAEKLLARRIQPTRILEFLALLVRLAEWVEVPQEAIRPIILQDPEDDPVIACAVVGRADYLVTYDSHFEPLTGHYAGIRIAKALPFLRALRGEQPTDEDPVPK
jgi:putative PIN family toxin of toxin-antitoxin system